MTHSAFTLLALVGWSIALVMALGVFRSALVLRGYRKANSFSASGDDFNGFGQRLTRAHANCYECLPLVAIVLLYAIATGQAVVTDGLAFVVLGARMAQSITHLISTSHIFVLLRFGFFLVQLLVVLYWLTQLINI